MGGGGEPKKGQHETEGAEGGNRPQLKKRGTQREDRGRNGSREPREAEERKGREQRGLPHPELLVHTVQGRSCGKVNSTGEFQSVFSHSQPSQDTMKMSGED